MTDSGNSDLGNFEQFAGDDEGPRDGDEPAGDGDDTERDGHDGGGGRDTPSTADGGVTEADDDQFGEYDGVEPTGGQSADAVGSVVVSGGLRVTEDGEDTTLRAFVEAGNRESVRLGRYLIVPYPDDEELFARITGLEYAQEFQTDDATQLTTRRRLTDGDAFDERDYKFLAELEPGAVLFPEDGGLSRRMVDRVPKPGATVREATDADQIKTGLDIPTEGVFLGHLSVGGEKVKTATRPPTVDYRLDDADEAGDPLVFRHTLVAGGTGSGKTHAAKNVLRQYVGRRYEMDDGRDAQTAVVVFDPQDEYAQLHDDNPAVGDDWARRLDREDIAYGGHDDTLALVPQEAGVSYSGDAHRAEQVPFTIPFSVVDEYDMPWLIAGASLNDNQYGALRHLLDRFFRNYDDGTYEEFLRFLDDPALREELDERGRVHEATFDAVTRRVRSVPRGIFDQDARPITELDTELVRPGGVTVVPTYHLSTSRAKETFVLAVATLLVDDKLSNDPGSDRIAETPLVLGMDEAHNFLTDAETVQARKVIQTFTEAAKQGRKERLGLFLVTQDPQDIADSVFKQVNTRLVLNLGDEDAIDSVNVPPSLASKVPYMETGQMVVYSPDNSEPVELTGLPVCVVRHGD
ncbi:ATP-binding protein [Halobaculum sp. MBLA0143]|uniref:ATP-binding protein n=1 Tax=Halobaculum sp. MBLA0143 TaxID=3079933 RepID=UPI003526345A